MRLATWVDREEVERICGHPEVRKKTAHDGAQDFTAKPWFEGKNLVALDEGVCFLGQFIGPGAYLIHTNVVPEARSPRKTLQAASELLMLWFLSTDVEVIHTQIPSNNRAAEWLARSMGFRHTFVQEKRWLQGGKQYDMHHWRLDIDDWILRGPLHVVGAGFHQVLVREGLDSHGEDPAHDCFVGAAIGMVTSGKAGKGVRIYNRWAMQAGYQPLTILYSQPLVIDAGDFLIYADNGNLTVQRKEKAHA